MRVMENKSCPERRDALAHDWLDLCIKINVLPVCVPNQSIDTVDFLDAMKVDAIILTGGNDISISKKGVSCNEAANIAPERDKTEFRILDYAVKNNVPLLGVCRGMQIINIYFDGSVKKLLHPDDHIATEHLVQMYEDTTKKAYGESIVANSYHSFGIYSEDTGDNIISCGHTKDGVCEAIRHKKKQIVGIQWHPERMSTSNEKDIKFINDVLLLNIEKE